MAPRSISIALALGFLGACLDRAADLPGSTGSTGSTGNTSNPVSTTGGASGESSSSTSVAGDDALPTTDDGTGGDSGPARDVPATLWECSIFEQDCPRGEKCMPWSNQGGSDWNATRCFPIAENPAGWGEPCRYEGTAVSGLDDCGAGLMCWHLDRQDDGVCVSMCSGTAGAPTCLDPPGICLISGSGALALCFPTCDPLVQDCLLPGEVCYPSNSNWLCIADESGEMGAYGDPCEYINACDPLHVCIGGGAFTSCAGGVGCCSTVCDVTDADADAACAALDPNQTCEPWYREGVAPPGYEHVGVCAVRA